MWNALAERAKEEHKRKYPHYRFQPKHDPEKKKKRQAAKLAAEKAERERLMREERERQGLPPMPEDQPFDGSGASSSARTLDPYDTEQEREHAMATRRQQVRNRNFLGHRRSSSVPLPSEAYPGYPYSNFGGPAHADPFNFANPAIANASLTNGIAIPTLPSNLGGLSGPTSQWMNNTSVSEEQNPQLGFAAPMQSQAQHPLALPRAGSPVLNLNTNPIPRNSGFGNFSGMSSMGLPGLGSGTMGMRAARQLQLGQLGRRASSTQPVLQHQLNSGLFNFNFAAQNGSGFPQPPYGQFNQPFGNDFGNVGQNEVGFDGFVGAVAEGFTNPFANSANDQTQRTTGIAASPRSAPNSASVYPSSIPPNANWYDIEAVDPMTPITSIHPQTSAPAPHSTISANNSGLLNHAFSFGNDSPSPSIPPNEAGSSAIQTSPKSASAPQSSVNSTFMINNSDNGYVEHSHQHQNQHQPQQSLNPSAGMGMRDSFDFTAFMSSLPGQSQAGTTHNHNVINQDQSQSSDGSHDSYGHHGQLYTTSHTHPGSVMLAQPTPLRRVELPCVAEVPQQDGIVQHTANNNITDNTRLMASTTENSGCASPADVYTPVQTQSYVEGHQKVDSHQTELQQVSTLDGTANLSTVVPVSYDQQQQQHMDGIGYNYGNDYSTYNALYDGSGASGLYVSEQIHGHNNMNQVNVNQNISYDGYDTTQYGDNASTHQPQQIHGQPPHEHSQDQQQQIPNNDGTGLEPRFSFSDFLNVNANGSPYLSSTAVN